MITFRKQLPLTLLLIAAILGSSILAFAEAFPISINVSGYDIPEKGIVEGKYIIPIRDDVKILSTATIEDDFEPGCVIVVLNQRTSMNNLEKTKYSPRDFSEVNCFEVVDLMPNARKLVQEEIRRREALADGSMTLAEYSLLSPIDIEPENYRTILQLTFKNESKEAVISALSALETRSDLYCSVPNYTMEYQSVYPQEWYTVIDGFKDSKTNPQNDLEWIWPYDSDKLQMPEAWAKTTGSRNVRVGVIDSGINYDHPEFYDTGSPHSSKVDIESGKDFCQYASPVSFIDILDVVIGGDDIGHGTISGGIIGANSDGVGMTGVCWDVTLVPLRVGGTVGVIRSLDYLNFIGLPSNGPYLQAEGPNVFATSFNTGNHG